MMEKSLPAKSVDIKIKENVYNVEFPNTGQFIEIACLKGKISDGHYETLTNSADANGAYSKMLVDMIATFNTMIPDLRKDINVPSILGLSLVESKELLDAYNDQWMPFFSSWIEVLNTPKVAA